MARPIQMTTNEETLARLLPLYARDLLTKKPITVWAGFPGNGLVFRDALAREMGVESADITVEPLGPICASVRMTLAA